MKFLSDERKCETKGTDIWKGARWRNQGRKEPAFSLYSTDPQDQVASLHSGLDRCAVLLSGMLRVDKPELVTHTPKAVTGGTGKSKPSTGPGKKTSKKFPPMTEKSSKQVPRAKCPPVSLSGVKEGHALRQSHLLPSLRLSQPLHGSAQSQPLTSVLLSVTQSESALHSAHSSSQQTLGQTNGQLIGRYQEASFNGEDIDSVPVKDTDVQSDTCLSMRAYDEKVYPGQLSEPHHDTLSGEDISAGKLRTVQYLLGELKTLIAGKGSIAERLLSHLEITVSSPQMNSSGFDPEKSADLQALHIQNAQLHRRVAFLNKQLKDKEQQHNTETLCTSEVLNLPEDLADAQSRLQEIQVILADVRKSLLDTKKQLRDSEARNAVMKSDLDTLRTKFVQSEQAKSEMASLAQQRLEKIKNLESIIKSGEVSECDTVVDLATSDPALKEQYDDHSRANERISKYLMTLEQPEASHIGGNVHMAAEREENTPEEAKMSSTLLRKQPSHPNLDLNWTHTDGFEGLRLSEQPMVKEGQRLFDLFLSEGKLDTMSTDCSMRSVSSFDTRDEAAFRDGLAALDASIASLQKTIKQDLGR
ncbi:coiled-coil domain-containing protein 14 isoform X3 [Syngnathoides biaculeatus]|uniref:coiled-coil domain-containing protein 14 isoform X3 n=1 Tax=Syngnathoides biaculeatus TaxID=300417 RepID=UPI002ADE6F3A|nr:coiled-coil domain-containing protein 14 isoform X3 [Syngnathoides biaculeatus]